MANWSQTAADDTSDLTGFVVSTLSRTVAMVTGQLVVCWISYSPGAIVSVTDSSGLNAYVIAPGSSIGPNGDSQSQAAYRGVSTTSGTFTVTVTFGSSASFCQLSIAVFTSAAGVALLPDDGATGQSQNSPGTGTDGATSTALTTAVDGDILIGYAQITSSTSTLTAGTGYTATSAGIVNASRMEWFEQTTHGAKAATFTMGTNTHVITSVAAFSPAGGGGGGRTLFYRTSLNGLSTSGSKQFYPSSMD